MDPLVDAADALHAGYHALGNAKQGLACGMLITNDAYPQVLDANLLIAPASHPIAAVDETVRAIGDALASPRRPHVHVGAGTHDPLEARLAADDWYLSQTLELVLYDELHGAAREVDIRHARTAADWTSVCDLFRADHVEEAVRDERLPYPDVVTDGIVASKHAKTPDVRVWLARDEGVDCGVFTSWNGLDGVGLVEDLFVRAEHRGRGVARALIHRAVADTRARGAGPVVIGALVDDTPKQLYRRIGFTPLLLRRCWMAPTAIGRSSGARRGAQSDRRRASVSSPPVRLAGRRMATRRR